MEEDLNFLLDISQSNSFLKLLDLWFQIWGYLQRLLNNWDQVSQIIANFVFDRIIQVLPLRPLPVSLVGSCDVSVDGGAQIDKSWSVQGLAVSIVLILQVEDESQVAVLVELGLVHRQIGITQSLAVHDRTHRNLVNVVLLFVVQEVFKYLVVFL